MRTATALFRAFDVDMDSHLACPPDENELGGPG
jgi:hypothetical protein